MTSKPRIEPWDELPEANLKKVQALTEAIHKATDSMEANLATDPIKIPGQNWACVSFVSPTGNQKCQSIGMKIRGVFDTHSEAVDHVKRLIRLDPTFDIYICDLYNWCLVPPDPEHVTDQTYQNEELHKLISEYNKNQIYAKEHFEERKREMMQQAADEARQSALKKIQEESESELSESISELEKNECHILSEGASREVIDVTELDSLNVSSEVTPSELMDQMMGGGSYQKN
jgi:hypothetical protein